MGSPPGSTIKRPGIRVNRLKRSGVWAARGGSSPLIPRRPHLTTRDHADCGRSRVDVENDRNPERALGSDGRRTTSRSERAEADDAAGRRAVADPISDMFNYEIRQRVRLLAGLQQRAGTLAASAANPGSLRAALAACHGRTAA